MSGGNPSRAGRESKRSRSLTPTMRMSRENEEDRQEKRQKWKASQNKKTRKGASSKTQKGAGSTHRRHSSLSKSSSSSSLSSPERSLATTSEAEPIAYETEDLWFTPVTLRLSVHDFKSRAQPKFSTKLFVGGKDTFPTELKITSSFSDVVSKVNQILSQAGKELKFHKTMNTKLYHRVDPQVSEPVDNFATTKAEQVTPMQTDVNWEDALLNTAYKQLGEDLSDDDDSLQVESLTLDLICVADNKKDDSNRSTAGNTPPSERATKKLDDKEISIAIFLHAPAQKQEEGKDVYKVVDRNDCKYVGTISPSNDEKIKWDDVYNFTVKEAMKDGRYAAPDGSSLVGKRSALCIQNDFSTTKVVVLKRGDDMWTQVRKRLRQGDGKPAEANNPKTSFLRLAVAKKKKDDNAVL